VSDGDSYRPESDGRLVSGAYLAGALRRSRGLLAFLAIVGAVCGLAIGVIAGTRKSASTTVLLNYSGNTTPEQAMATNLSLLKTNVVANAANAALGSHGTPRQLLSHYHGTILSDSVLRITADGSSSATAQRRAAAIAAAFLKFRAQIASEQLGAVVTSLRAQQAALQHQESQLDAQLQGVTSAPQSATIADLASARAAVEAQIQQNAYSIQTDTVTLQSAIQTSRVIDAASADASPSTKKALGGAVASGLVVGLALGVGIVLLQAIVTTRVRRRSYVAAILGAPVAVSVGPVLRTGWRRIDWPRRATRERSQSDLELIVRHLHGTLAAAPTRAMVVVAIDSLPVATTAVLQLEERLTRDGQRVVIVNESGADLPPVEGASLQTDSDTVLVLAVLDPAKGADHLREWASVAVAFVTAGRSTETKLEANARMIRSAALELNSVVLVDADPTDDSLGAIDSAPPVAASSIESTTDVSVRSP
jgi:capsular polysaccharide biosynthesis protein